MKGKCYLADSESIGSVFEAVGGEVREMWAKVKKGHFLYSFYQKRRLYFITSLFPLEKRSFILSGDVFVKALLRNYY